MDNVFHNSGCGCDKLNYGGHNHNFNTTGVAKTCGCSAHKQVYKLTRCNTACLKFKVFPICLGKIDEYSDIKLILQNRKSKGVFTFEDFNISSCSNYIDIVLSPEQTQSLPKGNYAGQLVITDIEDNVFSGDVFKVIATNSLTSCPEPEDNGFNVLNFENKVGEIGQTLILNMREFITPITGVAFEVSTVSLNTSVCSALIAGELLSINCLSLGSAVINVQYTIMNHPHNRSFVVTVVNQNQPPTWDNAFNIELEL